MHDLVVRGGTVIDGTGSRRQTMDIAIDNGVISELGSVGKGHREIDADGLLVTPGFVDVHTHYDAQVTWDETFTPSSWHGVTSVVMGNCGVGFAPVHDHQHDWLIGLMEGVEDIPGTNVIPRSATTGRGKRARAQQGQELHCCLSVTSRVKRRKREMIDRHRQASAVRSPDHHRSKTYELSNRALCAY